MPDIYYHVDTTHGSYNAMKASAATEHRIGFPGAELSIVFSDDGSEALIKVRARDSYSPSWESAPFVLNKWTRGIAADDTARLALVHSSTFRKQWDRAAQPGGADFPL
jgi:hypothetical protein